MIGKRLEAVNVIVDAQHRAHWLQETCDLAAREIKHITAERDRLAKEVERLRSVVNGCDALFEDILSSGKPLTELVEAMKSETEAALAKEQS